MPGRTKATKRVLAIVAAIPAARKFANLDTRPSPALILAIADAVEKTERILQRIDNRTRTLRTRLMP
jgi:hypothetical protein